MRHSGELVYQYDAQQPVTDAVLTSARASVDWVEHGYNGHLEATSTDGTFYRGNYGYPAIEQSCRTELTAYRTPAGAVLLRGRWWDKDGTTGTWVFDLTPVTNSHHAGPSSGEGPTG